MCANAMYSVSVELVAVTDCSTLLHLAVGFFTHGVPLWNIAQLDTLGARRCLLGVRLHRGLPDVTQRFFFPCLFLTRGVCFSRRAAALRALSIARASARLVASTSCVSASSASPTLISCDRRPARLRFSTSRSLFRWARSIGRSLVLTTKVNFVPSTGLRRPVPVD